jgi:ABC-2 type transport system permease protein
MQRGAVLGWGVALLGFGLILGSLAKQITESGSRFYSQMGGSDVLIDAYRGSMAQMAGMFVAIYVVQVLLRMRSEEAAGTLEPVLATGVTRARWVFAHLVSALLGATVLATGFCLALGVGAGLALGGMGGELSDMALAGVAQLPSILVMAAVVLVVVAVLPRWAVPVCWSLVIVALVLGPMFGPTLGLPVWLQNLSPFSHAPTVPATDLAVGTLAGLLVVFAVVGAIGLAVIRRRDLALPA